jgi:hypothetical protein
VALSCEGSTNHRWGTSIDGNVTCTKPALHICLQPRREVVFELQLALFGQWWFPHIPSPLLSMLDVYCSNATLDGTVVVRLEVLSCGSPSI